MKVINAQAYSFDANRLPATLDEIYPEMLAVTVDERIEITEVSQLLKRKFNPETYNPLYQQLVSKRDYLREDTSST